MQEWLSASEIADERLPEVPHTKRGINALAARDDWNNHPSFCRPRSGQIIEYNFMILPTLAQMAYKQKHLLVAATGDQQVTAPQEPESLTYRAQCERDARLIIVHAYNRHANGLDGLSAAATTKIFVDNYEMGRVNVDEFVKETVPSFSARTLRRWCDAVRSGDLSQLCVDRAQSRKKTGILDRANDGKVAGHILALIAQNAHYSGYHVRQLCVSEFGDQVNIERAGKIVQVDMPPVRAIQDFVKKLKKAKKVELTKLQNPDLYRSTMRASGTGSLRHIREPNELWQIDASPVDAMTLEGRPAIYACIDIATRRAVFLVSKTPRATAVALLIRKAILEWGVPRKIKTDNGSDFVARDTKRLFASLDIELELSNAYSPQEKGHVERVIKTFQHDCAVLLPGFVGHSVADRTAIENRSSFAKRRGETEAETFGVKLTMAEFQEQIDGWVNKVYSHRGHGGLNGQTPFQAALMATATPRMLDERALDMLLMPVAGTDGQRKVTKFGIRIGNYHYLTPTVLPGEYVFVRQDEHDLGRAYLFDPEGAIHLGEAICAELRGIHPATLAKATREAHATLIEKTTRGVRQDMKRILKGPNALARITEVAARNEPNVIPMKRPTDDHSTPQIAAALSAIDATTKTAKPDPMSPEKRVAHEKLIAELETQNDSQKPEATDTQTVGNIRQLRAVETIHQRFKRALELEQRVADGEEVGTKDALWLGGYQNGPEYKAMRRTHDESKGEMSL